MADVETQVQTEEKNIDNANASPTAVELPVSHEPVSENKATKNQKQNSVPPVIKKSIDSNNAKATRSNHAPPHPKKGK